jgi:hypothetical protein
LLPHEWQPFCWPVVRTLAALLVGSVTVATGLVLPSQAQLSPRCERNGKLDYCAVTQSPAKGDPNAVREVVVFANGDTYRIFRSDSACKAITPFQRACDAIIQPPSGAPMHAQYIGTYYEGGYRHEYRGKNLKIVYFYMD